MALSEADVRTKLETRRDAILAELEVLDSTKVGGKPNAPQTGVDHIGYKRSLYDELASIQQQLSQYRDSFEVVIEAYT